MTRPLLVPVMLLLCGTAKAAPVPWPYNMTVSRCEQTAEGFTVETTGAVFELLPARGVVRFAQKIAATRPLGELTLGARAMAGLRLASSDEVKAAFVTDRGLRLEVHCDSVLRLDAAGPTAVRVTGAFVPEHWAVQPGATVALDDTGGLGAYFLARGAVRAKAERTDRGFTIRDSLRRGQTFLLSVCPPREYDWRQHHDERIVHFFPELAAQGSPRPLPTDEELERWRKFANILVLHLEPWDGFGVQHIKPRDPVRYRQVVAKAHELGYQVLPYTSCFYYMPARAGEENFRVLYKDNAVDLYIEEAAWLLQEYQVDGLYWDGTFTDPLKAWEAARRMRQLLGSRKLYVHCTWDPIPYPGAICPFADTYADYLLKGEARYRETVDPMYLRYEVSGYNISNAVGDLCYDGSRVDRRIVDWALQANARIPYWPGFQVMAGRNYFLNPEEDQVFREYYVPLADQVADPDGHARHAAAGREARARRLAEMARTRQSKEAAFAAYLAERQAATAPGAGDNLARFRPVTCSDYAASMGHMPHGLGYRPEYATDENPETIWGADYPPHWVAVDLGKAQTVSAIRVVNYYADPRFYHYRVEVSADGRKWRKVAEKMDDAAATQEGTRHRFPATEARWVRVVMLSNSANCGVHVAEVEVYR